MSTITRQPVNRIQRFMLVPTYGDNPADELNERKARTSLNTAFGFSVNLFALKRRLGTERALKRIEHQVVRGGPATPIFKRINAMERERTIEVGGRQFCSNESAA